MDAINYLCYFLTPVAVLKFVGVLGPDNDTIQRSIRSCYVKPITVRGESSVHYQRMTHKMKKLQKKLSIIECQPTLHQIRTCQPKAGNSHAAFLMEAAYNMPDAAGITVSIVEKPPIYLTQPKKPIGFEHLPIEYSYDEHPDPHIINSIQSGMIHSGHHGYESVVDDYYASLNVAPEMDWEAAWRESCMGGLMTNNFKKNVSYVPTGFLPEGGGDNGSRREECTIFDIPAEELENLQRMSKEIESCDQSKRGQLLLQLGSTFAYLTRFAMLCRNANGMVEKMRMLHNVYANHLEFRLF